MINDSLYNDVLVSATELYIYPWDIYTAQRQHNFRSNVQTLRPYSPEAMDLAGPSKSKNEMQAKIVDRGQVRSPISKFVFVDMAVTSLPNPSCYFPIQTPPKVACALQLQPRY